jgi:DNA-binding LacI/PurR family transcriptional regulator
MGLIAVERILNEIQQGGAVTQGKGRVDLLPPELVQRESTAAIHLKGKVLPENAGKT